MRRIKATPSEPFMVDRLMRELSTWCYDDERIPVEEIVVYDHCSKAYAGDECDCQCHDKSWMFYKMWRQEFNLERFKLCHCPPEDFTISCLQKTERVLPAWVTYRTVVFLYFLVTLIYVVTPTFTAPEEDRFKFIIFLTNWTYILETTQFGIAFLITVTRYAREKKSPPELPMETIPCPYQVYWILFTITLPCAVVVSVMFWAAVYDPEFFPANAVNIILHALNSILMLIDFALVNHPVRFLHFYWPGFYGLLYGVFSVIYYLCGGTGVKGLVPIYKILDWRRPGKAVVTCIVCMSFVLLLHFLFSLLSMCKAWSKKTSGNE